MISTRLYLPLGLLLLLTSNLIVAFMAAVASGQIAIPPQLAWVMVGVASTVPTALFLMRQEIALLLGPAATQIAQAAALGNTQGIAAAGGLPVAALVPRAPDAVHLEVEAP